jgi:zinc transport system substrate-binding protein
MKRANLTLPAIGTLIIFALVTGAGIGRAKAAPKVAASILPVHALAAGVMAGVGAPDLLVPANVSPHDFALRPSTVRLLRDADLIVWVGEDLEPALGKAIAAQSAGATVLTLLDAPGLRIHGARQAGSWLPADQAPAGRDPHLWLDPNNAAAIVSALVERLSSLDPQHAPAYAANGERLGAQLAALDAELEAMLEPVRARPFMVYHDAFHYFERRYGLTAVGAVTLDPERAPGARRLAEIRRLVAARGVVCIFSEPQSASAGVTAIADAAGIRQGTLDDIGASIAPEDQPGEAAYFALMRALASNLTNCLLAK